MLCCGLCVNQVLATDLALHFELLSKFRALSLDKAKSQFRLEVMKMSLKCADVVCVVVMACVVLCCAVLCCDVLPLSSPHLTSPALWCCGGVVLWWCDGVMVVVVVVGRVTRPRRCRCTSNGRCVCRRSSSSRAMTSAKGACPSARGWIAPLQTCPNHRSVF